MRVVKLPKKNESNFLELLKQFGELWAPVKKGEQYTYAKITDISIIAHNALRTILPAKKLLIEPEYCLLKYTKKGFTKTERTITNKVIYGIHPCGINAINILNKFYTNDYIDPDYKKAREKLIIVGKSCMPDDKCFCNETHTDIVDEGYDLFLTELESYYLVWIGSSKGDDIIRSGKDIFEEKVEKEAACELVKFQKEREKRFSHDIDLKGVPDLMELEYDADFWEELGEKCLSCGQCTMVCPTCTCFNTIDEIELNQNEGKRLRYWDSCMFREYSMVAGGHNFRAARSERLKLWYTHKLKAFIGKFGSPSCVGCGRCIATCPVDINIKTVVSYLKRKKEV